MRWKRYVWAGSLAPLLGGCLTAYHPHRDHLAEHAVARSERDVTREIHRKAREAWQAVRCEFPRKVFTPEFRDGFIDGYSDYLDRGGDGQPPAAPPLRYTQNQKYFTPEGHALMRDFLLGFQYGTEVAVATGQRQYLTVPVLIPDGAAHSANIADPLPSSGTTGSDAPLKPMPPPTPLPAPRVMGKLPAPRPAVKDPAPRSVSVPSNEPEMSKFGPMAPPGSLVPPLPEKGLPMVPPLPGLPPIPTIPMVPMSVIDPPHGVIQASGRKLPEPPIGVKDLPDDVPTPPVPYEPQEAPMIPVNHPEPRGK